MDTVKMHEEICEYLTDLYARKNADYGDSFHETYAEEGMAMPRIRLGDKFRRFKNLTRGDAKVNDESIRDTLLDLANYAIMTVIELDRENSGLYRTKSFCGTEYPSEPKDFKINFVNLEANGDG